MGNEHIISSLISAGRLPTGLPHLVNRCNLATALGGLARLQLAANEKACMTCCSKGEMAWARGWGSGVRERARALLGSSLCTHPVQEEQKELVANRSSPLHM